MLKGKTVVLGVTGSIAAYNYRRSGTAVKRSEDYIRFADGTLRRKLC